MKFNVVLSITKLTYAKKTSSNKTFQIMKFVDKLILPELVTLSSPLFLNNMNSLSGYSAVVKVFRLISGTSGLIPSYDVFIKFPQMRVDPLGS